MSVLGVRQPASRFVGWSDGGVDNAAAAAVTTYAADTFTRANGALTLGNAETGGAWTAISTGAGPPTGTWGISSNQAYAPAPAVNGDIAYVTTAVSNCTVSFVISTFNSGDAMYLRGAAVEAGDNYLILGLGASLDFYQVVAGAFTPLSGVLGNGANVASGDTIAVVMAGTSITVKKNGATVYSLTTSTHQTNVRHGIRCTNAATRFDNFLVTS